MVKRLRFKSQENFDSNPAQGNSLPCDLGQGIETLIFLKSLGNNYISSYGEDEIKTQQLKKRS